MISQYGAVLDHGFPVERSRFLFIFSCFCLSAVIAGCSPQKPAPKSEGGQHTGGGNHLESSSVDVNTAIDLAIELLNEPVRRENIFVQFWFEWGRQSKNPIVSHPDRFFPDLKIDGETQMGEPSPTSLEHSQSPALNALKMNKVTRLATGDCPNSVIKRHTDASVSSFDLNAEICFSAENLARVSSPSLLREVLSLAIHEAAHMAGADENEAVVWQQEFAAYFTARFGDVSSDSVSTPTLRLLAEAKSLIGKARTLPPDSKTVRVLVERATQKLILLPDFTDELSLRLKTRPAHPDLIANYYNSVVALIRQIQINFDFQFEAPRIAYGTPQKVKFIFPEFNIAVQIPKALDDISESLDRITGNFLAFTGEDTDSQSVCAIADQRFDISYLSTKPLSESANRIFFPRRCTPPTPFKPSKFEPIDI